MIEYRFLFSPRRTFIGYEFLSATIRFWTSVPLKDAVRVERSLAEAMNPRTSTLSKLVYIPLEMVDMNPVWVCIYPGMCPQRGEGT